MQQIQEMTRKELIEHISFLEDVIMEMAGRIATSNVAPYVLLQINGELWDTDEGYIAAVVAHYYRLTKEKRNA